MRKESNEIYALNALKFICAIMVVGIHIPFVASPYLLFLYRIAVPMFFMISGYFSVDSSGKIPMSRIKKILKKILFITVGVNLIYYVFKAMVYNIYSWPLIGLIVDGGVIVAALWYMNAYLVALLIIWCMVKFNVEKWLTLFIPIGLSLNLIFGSYYWLFFENPPEIMLSGSPNKVILSRNFLTIALPCLSAGILIRLKESPISVVFLMISTLLLLLALFIENNAVESICPIGRCYGDIVFLTVPFTACLFLLAINIRNDIKFIQVMAGLGKKHSMNLFLFHLLAHAILLLVVVRLPFELPDMDYWRMPVTVLLTIFGGYLYGKYSSHIKQFIPFCHASN